MPKRKSGEAMNPPAAVAVPSEVAYRLCQDIRQEGRHRWYSYSTWWCWGCTTFTSGEAAKRCGAVVACPQVVKRYQRMQPPVAS